VLVLLRQCRHDFSARPCGVLSPTAAEVDVACGADEVEYMVAGADRLHAFEFLKDGVVGHNGFLENLAVRLKTFIDQ
jgi:hypothetical protein